MDRRPSTRVVGALWAFVVFTSVGLALLPGIGVAAGSSGGTKGQPTLALLGQSPWVGPNQSFSAHLAVKGTSASSSTALEVTVYSYLTSRSAFDQTLTGPPPGRVLSQSSPVSVSSLPADPGGGFDASVAVSTGSVSAGSVANDPFSVDLRCPLGSCGGVYPVTLTLTNASGKTTFNQLTTYLVYDSPPTNTERLRLSVVVPLGLAPQAPDATGQLAPPSEAGLSAVTALAAGLATHPEVPVTVAPDPASALTMSTDGRPSAHRALTSVTDASAVASRQVVCSPFTPVNPSAMFADGLGSELSDQIKRGAEVLSALGVHTPTCAGPQATWIAGSTLDPAAIDGLAALGYHDVIVPPGAAVGPSTFTTPTRLFTLSAAKATADQAAPGTGLTAAQSDPGLGQQLQAASGPDAVLAGYQFLSELALIYYEAPNATTARGVVAVAPDGWSPSPAFLSSVLGGLDQNPVIAPVTLDQLFTQVPVGGTVGGVTEPAVRHPAAVTEPTGAGALPARAIRSARERLDGFAAAVDPTGSSIATGLQDLLLRSESAGLKASQQASGVAGADAALARQLSMVSIRDDTIRMTSISASVPITVLHNAPYLVTGTLCLSSDKLLFPSGRCQEAATLQRQTNSFTFAIRARASGDFRLSATLTSPDGQLVLANAQLSVRSMSTSAVAIALSLAAVAVLLVWWGRTLWRGRRSGRGAHAQSGRRSRGRDGEIEVVAETPVNTP